MLSTRRSYVHPRTSPAKTLTYNLLSASTTDTSYITSLHSKLNFSLVAFVLENLTFLKVLLCIRSSAPLLFWRYWGSFGLIFGRPGARSGRDDDFSACESRPGPFVTRWRPFLSLCLARTKPWGANAICLRAVRAQG